MIEPLTLSEEQKARLLEMVKHFYGDEYVDIIISTQHILFVTQWFKVNPPQKRIDTSIHWYEFCLTYLATCIYNMDDHYALSISSYRGYLAQDCEDMIAEMYETFKETITS